jgi:transposase
VALGLEDMSREELLALVLAQANTIEALTQRVAELERQVAADSSNSSRPPSSDAPWAKQPAKKRSSRTRSGRKPGKQPGASSSSRSLIDDPDQRLEIRPDRCQRCDASLGRAQECDRQRRQIVDLAPVPPPTVTEYQRISLVCRCCGAVTTPGWDDAAVPVEHAGIVAASGSPVRIGPEVLARAALLTCAHYLPIGRARDLLEKLTAIDVSTGLLAGIRGPGAVRRAGWRKRSSVTSAPCWLVRRCCMPTKHPAAPLARWPTCMWPAPNTSP